MEAKTSKNNTSAVHKHIHCMHVFVLFDSPKRMFSDTIFANWSAQCFFLFFGAKLINHAQSMPGCRAGQSAFLFFTFLDFPFLTLFWHFFSYFLHFPRVIRICTGWFFLTFLISGIVSFFGVLDFQTFKRFLFFYEFGFLSHLLLSLVHYVEEFWK